MAKALGLKEEQVTHHQCYLGGGFGRRNGGYEAAEAALSPARSSARSSWCGRARRTSRRARFRPQSFQCLEAATDASGKVIGWKHCVIGDGGNALLTGGMRIPYYGVPNQALELRGISHGVQIKHWRAVAHVFNVFAIESFIDQMAVDANMDPIEFRFERMAAPRPQPASASRRWRRCATGRPSGRKAAHIGIALTERSGSLGAGVGRNLAQPRRPARSRVHKVWVAVDGGQIVHPGPGQGQRRERDHLRALQHPARAHDASRTAPWSRPTSMTTT